ncbi:CDP-alcohol phosphatidyltransferase family protein [Flavobacteriaceae bacterium]|nr:CDP-alcohol phosphatidyltransferase family protein [Flavobacteriaceae bacterium]MDC0462572.1 CDP-alcohol phosphatidyltransferase family protein [Flavobacteriaceae bacterium]
MKAYIPNFITLLNLLSGSIAVIYAIGGDMKFTALFVCIGIFFDFFDGFIARKLKLQSGLGVQLDSLADMVTSGLVPGLVLFHLFSLTPQLTWDNTGTIPYFGLLVTLASAYRLAKFNLSDNQSDFFIGLPVPANTLWIIALPLILEYQPSDAVQQIILNPWFLIVFTIISSYLLNAPFKLIALKFKNWNFKDNIHRYILIIFSLTVIMFFQFIGIPIAIIGYLVLSLIFIKQ